MVRALLDGLKSQTRRVMKPQPHGDAGPIFVGRYHPLKVDRRGMEFPDFERFGAYCDEQDWPCPYVPGQLLWVRETWAPCIVTPRQADIAYRADGEEPNSATARAVDLATVEDAETAMHYLDKGAWVPAIFMPRWASRITLEVTAVRVERLQDISEDDACAEGVGYTDPDPAATMNHTCTDAFAHVWDRINGKRATWKSNPWVWVVSFRRTS